MQVSLARAFGPILSAQIARTWCSRFAVFNFFPGSQRPAELLSPTAAGLPGVQVTATADLQPRAVLTTDRLTGC